MKSLLDCTERESVTLQSFSSDINSDFINDLMDIGLLPGTMLVIYPHFPYSNKIILKVGDSLLSIRKQDAKNIFIQESIKREPNERPL
jgi:Fe2+ transport system protein FeoA